MWICGGVGGGSGGLKRQRAGTGVFLPRRYENNNYSCKASESRKKPGNGNDTRINRTYKPGPPATRTLPWLFQFQHIYVWQCCNKTYCILAEPLPLILGGGLAEEHILPA